MQSKVIVDTGPLVALLDSSDAAHAICKQQFEVNSTPGFTSWAVLTEVAWLVRKSPGAFPKMLELLEAGAIVCLEPDPAFPGWCRNFLPRYDSLKPQLADATLVHLADRLGTTTIFTLDRRDFTVFRNQQGQPFDLLPANLSP